MTPAEFNDRRRQKFLTLQYYELNEAWIERTAQRQHALIAKRQAAGDVQPFGQQGVYLKLMQRVLLRYAAGASIETVSRSFDEMFAWFCRWHLDYPPHLRALEVEFGFGIHMDASPLQLDEIEDFHKLMTVLGLAVLLGKGRELAMIADLLVRLRGEDLLVEELLSPAVEAVDCNEFFHVEPYDSLIDAYFTADTGDRASAFVKKYLDGWYQAMEPCAWHNSHTIAHEDMSPYNGYWSFESAAICLIHDIDDASFRDNLVYPKDLIDWARANDSLGKLKAAAAEARGSSEPRLRCQSGDPCPRDGWWFTPARADSRQRFQAGDVMPDVGGPWGLTIWQRDPQQ